jgi:DNA-directed RNA polymerase subunit M/transcription elongation factor TFIIS
MFCPKCGNELVRVGNELTCVEGKMGLMAQLEQRLIEYFVAKTAMPSDRKVSFVVGGEWYCPGCGVPTIETDGYVRCPRCGLSLNEFIYVLVEIHPHKQKGDHSGWPKRNT